MRIGRRRFSRGGGISSGAPVRMATATTMAPTIAVEIKKGEMIQGLHKQKEFADRFISYMLKHNLRIEADLVDQLFNSSEKRLARALLLLARYGKEGQPETIVGKISQETLAELVGTTRSRVNVFMNKFWEGGLQVSTAPTAFEQNNPGNLSDLLGTDGSGNVTGQIYDPLTTNPADSSRTPFSGNIIPPCVGATGRSASGGGCLDPAALNRVRGAIAPDTSKRSHRVQLAPGFAHDVLNQDSAHWKRIPDKRTVTAPRHSFRAHQCAPFLPGQLDQRNSGPDGWCDVFSNLSVSSD